MSPPSRFPTLCLLVTALILKGVMAASAGVKQPYAVSPRLPEIRDKTLVVWTTVANKDQRGGSALTLECQDRFDGIVFGEIRPGVWMVGSDGFRRTQTEQSAYREEEADAGTTLRMAAVYRGNEVTLWRNDEVLTSYRISDQETFRDGSTVLIGLRHEACRGAPNSYFAGVVEEARIYDRALSAEELRALGPGAALGPKPVAQFTFEDGTARDQMGTFPNGELFGGAFIQDGKLHLNGREAFMMTLHGVRFTSPIHYRPATGLFADPIPFYWQGAYHVFYLQGSAGPVPWQHIVSRDLVHWEELPTALRVDGAADGPDGGAMFTGCVVEREGVFHIFYTGHNPANPAGIEFIRHATSADLIHWAKDPEFILGPDGVHYAKDNPRNWRDPYVFWNEEEQQYWMVVIATAADDRRDVQGLLVSRDLETWHHQPRLEGAPGQECPDLFRIGDTWYLIGGHSYSWATSPRGLWVRPPHDVIDRPGVYAGKRMFDGRRHVWTGWAWDGAEYTDAAVSAQSACWGGTQCLPRELYPGPEGQLFCKPVEEAVAFFGRTVLDLTQPPDPPSAAGPPWTHAAGSLVLRGLPWVSQCTYSVPDDALIECRVRMAPGAELTVAFREQPDTGEHYRLVLRPAKQEIALGTATSEWVRSNCRLDISEPIKVQAFMIGTMLECFVNDAYALTRRMYDLGAGKLGFTARGGDVEIVELQVKTP